MHDRSDKYETNEQRELREKLDAMSAEERAQIRPFFHLVQNEILQPHRKIDVSRYFLEKWMPDLGPFASLVISLRLHANNKGKTYSSQKKIAVTAGLSVRTLKRMLSTNLDANADRSAEWRSQWSTFHRFFFRRKESRLRPSPYDSGPRFIQTTNEYEIAMDDPVHPSDYVELDLRGLSRMMRTDKSADLPGGHAGPRGPIPPKGHDGPQAVTVDSPPQEGHDGPRIGGPRWPTQSTLDRKNVQNVSVSIGSSLKSHPSVSALSPEERASKTALARTIGERLERMNDKLAKRRGARASAINAGITHIGQLMLGPSVIAHDSERHEHKDYGFHWIVAHFMPDAAVTAALAATEDAVEDDIQAVRVLRTTADRYFTGVIRRICEANGIVLPGVAWQMPSKGHRMSADASEPSSSQLRAQRRQVAPPRGPESP